MERNMAKVDTFIQMEMFTLAYTKMEFHMMRRAFISNVDKSLK
jgi:hypothetical protein